VGLAGKGWADVTVLKAGVRRLRLKCDGTRAETRFRLLAKRRSPFKSARASVQSTTGSRGGRISGNSAGYTMFRGSVKSTGYPLHSTVFPSLPLPFVTVCHHISTGLYLHTGISHHCSNSHTIFPIKIYAHELQRSRDLVVIIVTTFCVGDPGIVV
jgi:hypothetical protein